MKVYIQTHGCSNNFYETEIMMGILSKNNFEITANPADASVLIINICTVKGNDTVIRTIRTLKELYPEKKLIVAGCISKDIIPEIRKIDESAGLVNTHNITSITEVIEELMNDNVLESLARTPAIKLDLPKIRLNSMIGIVPIASGCVDHCTYCSVKLIKGHIYSYPKEKIIKEVQKNLMAGCKEIWLTSQDNGAYGMEDNEHKLPSLLREILKIKGDFKIRLGMMNPHHVLKFVDDLIDIYQDDRMFKFIHLPVESGNNEILTAMKRKYNIFEYKSMVEKLRKNIKSLTLATDMIVGFPGETEIQFHDSLNLINELKPDVLNISKFHPRPNTKAAKLKPLQSKVIKERSQQITKLYRKVAEEQNKKWIDWVGYILVSGKGKNDTFIGRNFAYKQVVLEGNYKIGDKVKVVITDGTSFDLRGSEME